MSKYELTDWDDDEKYISLIGLFSHWPDHKLAHYLNKLLGISLRNSPTPFELSAKNNSGKYSYFTGELNYNPIYLISNKSFSKSNKSGQGLFAEVDVEIDQHFLKSLNRWPFLLLTVSAEQISRWDPLTVKNTLSTHVVDFMTLNKYEQKTLNEFTYAE